MLSTMGVGSLFAQDGEPNGFTATALTPESTYSLPEKNQGEAADSLQAFSAASGEQMVSVIVKLADDSLAAYDGGVLGLKATSPSVTGAEQLDVKSADSQLYLAYLAEQQSAFEATALKAIPEAQVTHRFDVILGGVAMIVPESQVGALAGLPGVQGVYADDLLQVDTERSPQFIDAQPLWNELGGQDDAGEGVIVGVLDTGIWPEHPSFSDPDPSGEPYAAPPSWNGTACEFGSANPNDPPFTCNNKLIGADQFLVTYKAVIGLLPGEFNSVRDSEGHGTHTTSTAAGNRNVAASIFGVPRGIISGIAPRAHVAMYRVCANQGCFTSDSAAAVQRAILDGVDVINFSISGGTNPYSDIVSLAFLDAYNAGVFVAASAGNSGPGLETVNHREPWVATVGASTTDRHFISTVTLTADNGDTLTLTGASVTGGISTPTPVVLPLAAAVLCGANDVVNPFAPGTFNGEIVVCQRGGSARVTKSRNVRDGGGAGMLLYNPVLQGLATDNHFIPSVHLENNDGATLLAFLSSHTGVMATFTQGVATTVQGDKMAAFSSRGGPGQSLGISKPDVTAPGVQILAGHSPLPHSVVGGLPGQLFQAIQGTSMSSPHVAGAAALLRDLHPTWTPGQIKSALMTTARTNEVFKEDGVTPFTPFDAGSGRIDLHQASDPGITFDETGANYLALQNQLWNANYPSVYIPVMPGQITVQRMAHSVLNVDHSYTFKLKAPKDVAITVPENLVVPANGDASFNITIDARNVPIGEVRHATLFLSNGHIMLHFPITIVRKQPVVTQTKACNPANFSQGSTTACTLTLTNTSFDTANVNLTDQLPSQLQLVSGSVVNATESGNGLVFNGALFGASPPNPSLAPGSSIAGYLPLSLFGITPIGGVGDDTLTNFNVPAFTYAGETYTRLGVSSNGYLVVGGGSGPDNTFLNQNLPNPNRPNNVLAAFWTDLNPAAAGAMRIATLTDGVDTWIVVDWAGVREFSTAGNLHSFEIWIGVNGDANPGEDISFAYGPNTGAGDLGLLTVGVENRFGNRGNNIYFNGAGTLPGNGTELRVTSAPPTPGETRIITFQATGVKKGNWQNCAETTSNLFQGVNIACFNGRVR